MSKCSYEGASDETEKPREKQLALAEWEYAEDGRLVRVVREWEVKQE